MTSFRTLLNLKTKRKSKKNEKDNIIPVTDIKDRQPWVEKYRPKTLNKVVNQEDVIMMLQNTLKTGSLPHMLLYGKSGIGKTSVILALAIELYGPTIYKNRILELNASDERGINIVRNKIITFAKTAIGSKDPKYPSPSYKIIILDEADAMTTEAQSALRKIMEDYAHITRFCFICNYVNHIIDPIKSRCISFRFKPINENSLVTHLKSISLQESINITDSSLTSISDISEGDMRKAIMILQNLKYAKGTEMINTKDITDITNCISEEDLLLIKKLCFVFDNKKKNNITGVINLTKKIIKSGYPINNSLNNIYKMVINSDVLTDKMKGVISLKFSSLERRVVDGGDEYLQLLNGLMCIKTTCNNEKYK